MYLPCPWRSLAQSPNAVGVIPINKQTLPASSVNGHGSFVAPVPTPEGPAWFAGSTYDRHTPHAEVLAAALGEAFAFEYLIGVVSVMADKDVIGVLEAIMKSAASGNAWVPVAQGPTD